MERLESEASHLRRELTQEGRHQPKVYWNYRRGLLGAIEAELVRAEERLRLLLSEPGRGKTLEPTP